MSRVSQEPGAESHNTAPAL